MINFSCLLLLFYTFNSAYSGDGSVSSVFSSLRRTDHSDEKTYHFSRVSEYQPVHDPIIYADGFHDNTKMIVGFNNMIVFGKFETDKHYVIRVSEDLDEDTAHIPIEFLNGNDDSGELFDIVTLKPTTTTTTARTTSTTRFTRFRDMVKDIQRETLPGFDPDKQSLTSYLTEVSLNASRMAQSIEQ